MFRLMPASSVAEAAFAAYGSTRLHWYVPEGVRWIDRIKGFSAEMMRRRIMKNIPALRSDKP